ncbi:MAG: hypothetical protein RR523_14840 [Cetobacterium sp.]|uniref:hypothetical protein n=1 Tax=Cetobacterium sp. TaxID=2071632 RepID=UPI002FC87E3E
MKIILSHYYIEEYYIINILNISINQIIRILKSHAKSKELVDLIIYSHDEPDKTLDQFYQNNFNRRLILSNNL